LMFATLVFFLRFLSFCGVTCCLGFSILEQNFVPNEYEVGVTKKRKNEENRLNYAYFDAQLRENAL